MKIETTWERPVYRKLKEKCSIDHLRTVLDDPSRVRIDFNELRATLIKERTGAWEQTRQFPEKLASVLDVSADEFETYLTEIQYDAEMWRSLEQKRSELENAGVKIGAASRADAIALYLLCRALEPDVVVQTGVKYGGYDAFISTALERNDRGQLYSVDLPDAVDEFEFGYLIPEGNRSRWNLRLGDANEILPELLEEVGPVDVFLHDSSHTYSHMTWEYETAYPHLTDDGVLASHDVLMTSAFQDFVADRGMDWVRARNTGVAPK